MQLPHRDNLIDLLKASVIVGIICAACAIARAMDANGNYTDGDMPPVVRAGDLPPCNGPTGILHLAPCKASEFDVPRLVVGVNPPCPDGYWDTHKDTWLCPDGVPEWPVLGEYRPPVH